MKKLIALAIVVFTTVCQIYSQHDWYVQLNAGYGLSTSLTHISYMTTDAEISTDTIIENNIYTLVSLSTGKGPVFSAAIGKRLSKVFDLEMSLFYKKAGPSSFEFKTRWDIDGGYYVRFEQFNEYSGFSVGLAPILKTNIPVINNSLYFRTGLLFYMSKLEKYTDLRIFNTHPEFYPLESYTSNMEYESAVGIGFLSGVGMNIQLMDQLYLCPELDYKLMRYSPTSSEITEYKYRGEDQLDELSVNERKFVYVNEYDDQDNQNPDSPSHELKNYYRLDHMAFNLGLKLEF